MSDDGFGNWPRPGCSKIEHLIQNRSGGQRARRGNFPALAQNVNTFFPALKRFGGRKLAKFCVVICKKVAYASMFEDISWPGPNRIWNNGNLRSTSYQYHVPGRGLGLSGTPYANRSLLLYRASSFWDQSNIHRTAQAARRRRRTPLQEPKIQYPVSKFISSLPSLPTPWDASAFV